MNRIVATFSVAAAFTAGCFVSRMLPPTPAWASEEITAQVIHVPS